MNTKSPTTRGSALLAAGIVAVTTSACEPPTEGVDLVLLNGNVLTVDPDQPRAEGVAMEGQTIAAVGSSEEMEAYIGPDTEVMDLDGLTAMPGFIEGHGHFMSMGQAQMRVDLMNTRSWQEVVDRVADAVEDAEPGEWVTGRGWHQEDWEEVPEETYDDVPTHHSLSEVSPENPVLLTHTSGHASFANARALEEAGVDADTPDPEGGTIVRDAEGNPTGFLRQAAQGLVSVGEELSQEELEERRREQVRLAGEEALRHGITTFHDAGSSFATIDFFEELAQDGELPLRLWVNVRGESDETMAEELADHRRESVADHFLTVHSVKAQIDGALGTHGAWLLEPYADMPESTGLPQTDPEDLRATAEIVRDQGFQLYVHAIGDRGNREVLDIYEEVLQEDVAENGNPSDHRWGIEHAQHLHPDDIPRFGELGIIASMQGIHGTSDGPWVEPRLGEERAREGAYAWRSLIDTGAVICNGTDAPVEPVDPIASYYASVSRMMDTGERFFEEQAMTRQEALESYTINCAYKGFQEDLKGSLEPGKLADIVVLDQDLLEVEEDAIPETEVVHTILGGEIVYSR